MDGILLINKPSDWTSFDVIKKLRGAAKEKRIGHAGTLDPMATGVLPIMLGKATPLCDRLPILEKRYIATVQLGIVTDTQDITGTVLKEAEFSHVTEKDVMDLLPQFRGEITQLPPMYSAIWVDGQRLYDLARKGIEVERKPRQMTIHNLSLTNFDGEKGTFVLDVTCSKGTYIRTIAHDIGELLGCGAALSQLQRTMSSGFLLADCITLEEAVRLGNEGTLAEHLRPTHTAFTCYPDLYVGEWQKKMLCNGVQLSLKKVGNPEPGFYRVWYQDQFLGLGTAGEEQLHLKQL